jgi:hypothetical protein
MSWKKLGGYEALPPCDLARNGENTETVFKLIGAKAVNSKLAPGKTSMVYTVEIEGEKMQFWGNAVLDSRLAEATPGSNVKVVYLGEVPNKVKGMHPYKNYDVFVEDGEPETEAQAEVSTGSKKKVPF